MSSPTITRPETIDTIINGIGRYNPAHIQLLEEYLNDQCRESGSDLQSNLALLKLYQFNVDTVKPEMVATVLAKALLMLPEPDFNLCLYLLNDAIISEERVAHIIALHQMVVEARYTDAWTALDSDDTMYRESVSGVPDFDGALRQLIASVIGSTYQTLDKPVLQKQLNLSSADLDTFIAEQSWSVASDGTVTIPINESNAAVSSVLTESLSFEQMTRVLAHANVH